MLLTLPLNTSLLCVIGHVPYEKIEREQSSITRKFIVTHEWKLKFMTPKLTKNQKKSTLFMLHVDVL
jgi:hypothetical protein